MSQAAQLPDEGWFPYLPLLALGVAPGKRQGLRAGSVGSAGGKRQVRVSSEPPPATADGRTDTITDTDTEGRQGGGQGWGIRAGLLGSTAGLRGGVWPPPFPSYRHGRHTAPGKESTQYGHFGKSKEKDERFSFLRQETRSEPSRFGGVLDGEAGLSPLRQY